MDNITHTIVGALVGEVASRIAPSSRSQLPAPLRRNLCVTLGAIGSNLPDSDLLYSFVGGKVNYLLHHRGHTHTLLIALLLGAAAFAVTRWWLRRRGLQPSRQDQWLLAGVLLVTPLLHIGMDFTNNYGVHPFWPLNNRWFHGDSVFIIEPLFWAACVPLAFIFRTWAARGAVALLLATAIGLCFFSGLVPTAIAIAYCALVAGMLLLGWKASARVGLSAAVTVWLGATLMFSMAAQSAKSQIDGIIAAEFPHSQLLDRIVTPMPSNPLCWEVMTVEIEAGKATSRRAMLALAPSLIDAERCLNRSLDKKSSAPLMPVASRSNDRVRWFGQIATPLNELATLAKTNCQAAAALRFIRAPWVATVDGKLVLGDLRYDREPDLGFAEIELADDAICPPFVPPWKDPRRDLLDAEMSQHE